MIEIPLALRTNYADLLDKLLDEAIRGTTIEEGIFVVKTVKNRRYWYRQIERNAKRRQIYVGPETPELLKRIEQHESLRETARGRREIVRALSASGTMSPPDARIGRVIEALASAGLFRLRAVIVGTVAFGCYGPMLGLRLPATSLMTGDIDIAQFRSISIAVEDTVPPVLGALQAVDPAFKPVTLPLYEKQPVGYMTQGRAVRDPVKIEFLTPMRGPVEDAPGSLPALGMGAQPLRFLDYLIYQERPAAMLYGSGILVNVPHPARYAWHKCIVAERRILPEKVSKDLKQAEILFDALCRDWPHDVSDMWEELAGPGRVHWQDIALHGLARIDSEIRDRVLKQIGRTP